MNFYFEIELLPDPEFPETILMNSLYAKLHKALSNLHPTKVGISFPNYQATLGNLIRLHGNAEALDKLRGQNWIGGMNGYCKQSDIKPVPTGTCFCTVSRKQPTMSAAKLKRLIKRGTITEEDAKNYRAKMFTRRLDNPYLELVSGSNAQRHRRYIEFGPLLDSPVDGEFDQFGLSKTATIPWF